MRILVVDDEQPARERLGDLVVALGHEVCGEAANGMEALHLIEQIQPDVVLLDIRMPQLDGLDTARHLATLPTPPAIIFTTAHDEHALEAFEAGAVDYLLKPVRREHLERALGRARAVTRAQLAELQARQQLPPARSHLCVRIGNRLELIPLQDIYYFQAEQKYVTVRHRQGEAIIEEPLKSLETEFAPRFLRIHRNALVSTAYLRGLVRTSEGRYQVVLDDLPEQLEISRRHLATVRQRVKSL